MSDSGILSPTRLPVPSSSSVSSSSMRSPKKDASKRQSLLLPGSTITSGQRGALASPARAKSHRPMSFLGGDMQSLSSLSVQFSQEKSGGAGTLEESEYSAVEDARAAAHTRLTGVSGREKGGNTSKIEASCSNLEPRATRNGIPRVERSKPAQAQMYGQMLPPPRKQSTSIPSSHPLPSLAESKALSRPSSMASSSSRSSVVDSIGSDRTTKLPSSSSANTNHGTSTTSLRRTVGTAPKHLRTQSALPTPSNLPGVKVPGLSQIRRQSTVGKGAAVSSTRPVFSTLQQHYSPQKVGTRKPASSTLIRPQVASDQAPTLGLDVQFLQARLSQLMILYRESARAFKSWEQDAMRKLLKKFDMISTKCGCVQQQEREVLKRANMIALRDWAGGDTLLLAERIEVLASVVMEVMQLLSPDGRVQGALDIFQEWITYVSTIWDIREAHQDEGDVEFIDSLGEAWRSEMDTLGRRLAGMSRLLGGFERPKQGSSVQKLLDGIMELIRGVTEELKIALKVELDVINKERAYISEQVVLLENEVHGEDA